MGAFWPIAKELTGFVGALLMAIPWMRDFDRRRKKAKVQQVKAEASLEKVQAELVAEDETWLSRAKDSDLYLTLGGLLLVATSFLIGLCLAD